MSFYMKVVHFYISYEFFKLFNVNKRVYISFFKASRKPFYNVAIY